ncbi:MAG: hypothetical protein L0H73_15935 [Nitrococcus sp.]|nr:hypothetical protein [Nitrococcus sp.]
MRYASISAATEALRQIANHEADHVMVMRDNRPAAVMLSVEHYRALAQLRELMRDPGGLAEMLQVHREAMQGSAEGPSLEEYAAQRAERHDPVGHQG